MVNSDASTTAMSSISRLTSDLGEKTVMICSEPLIAECIRQKDWVAR